MRRQEHLPATQKSTPLKTGELKLLEALQEKKIFEESVENINGLFRFCFLIVGLREKNFPNDLETLFLHQFLIENYGGHSISEIKIAFNMAVTGKLSIDPKDVTCYENFSVMYLSSIINAYRLWSSQEYRRLEQFIPPNENDQKLLEGPRKEIHWGVLIEREYQHFLSFGEEHWKIFPVGFYSQLVVDGICESDFFQKAMPKIRKMMVGDLIREKVKLEMHKFDPDTINERIKFAESINKTNIMTVQGKINFYQSGEGDSELVVIAKQYCVLAFFRQSKKEGKVNVYQPE